MAAKRGGKPQGGGQRSGEGAKGRPRAKAAAERAGTAEASETKKQVEAPREKPPAETKQGTAEPARRAEETRAVTRVEATPVAPAVGDLADHAAATYRQGRDAAADYVHTARERIRAQPIQSLLVAAGVGVFIGLTWR